MHGEALFDVFWRIAWERRAALPTSFIGFVSHVASSSVDQDAWAAILDRYDKYSDEQRAGQFQRPAVLRADCWSKRPH
ncbi:hypothetical protein CWO89_38655 [Bradyrhizobium sp. Leo170]|nr:hypothetical protein CWO89_38655 [Bradyrhizobium sp. Leo170]